MIVLVSLRTFLDTSETSAALMIVPLPLKSRADPVLIPAAIKVDDGSRSPSAETFMVDRKSVV